MGTGKSLLEVQVMTTFNPLKLVTIVLVIGLATIPLYAQEQSGAQPGQSPSSGQSSAQSAQAQPQTFSGKIVKSKGGLALKDEATNTTYKLDNEDQAKQYAGKSVKVTGTMDPATNTIHVANIEMANAGSSPPKQ
jgi:lipopolysaccharide export system protein LptA